MFLYCVQMNKDTIVRFSAYTRTILLVSGEVKFIRIFAGDHPQRGIQVKHPPITSENLTQYPVIDHNVEMVQDGR